MASIVSWPHRAWRPFLGDDMCTFCRPCYPPLAIGCCWGCFGFHGIKYLPWCLCRRGCLSGLNLTLSLLVLFCSTNLLLVSNFKFITRHIEPFDNMKFSIFLDVSFNVIAVHCLSCFPLHVLAMACFCCYIISGNLYALCTFHEEHIHLNLS